MSIANGLGYGINVQSITRRLEFNKIMSAKSGSNWVIQLQIRVFQDDQKVHDIWQLAKMNFTLEIQLLLVFTPDQFHGTAKGRVPLKLAAIINIELFLAFVAYGKRIMLKNGVVQQFQLWRSPN